MLVPLKELRIGGAAITFALTRDGLEHDSITEPDDIMPIKEGTASNWYTVAILEGTSKHLKMQVQSISPIGHLLVKVNRPLLSPKEPVEDSLHPGQKVVLPVFHLPTYMETEDERAIASVSVELRTDTGNKKLLTFEFCEADAATCGVAFDEAKVAEEIEHATERAASVAQITARFYTSAKVSTRDGAIRSAR